MLSKLRRSQSETYDRSKVGVLRGMPALKQMRSSKRQQQENNIWVHLPKFENPPPPLNEFERTGVFSNVKEMKYIGEQPDLLQMTKQNTPDVLASAQLDTGSREPELNKEKEEIGSDVISDILSRNSSSCQNPNHTKPKPRVQPRGDKNKGRNLHNIKEQRKAHRESDITKSMRALTPRERESIMCLEEVLKHHAANNASDKEDCDDEVFGTEKPAVQKDIAQNDDESDVESIIDMVGNLSDFSSSSTTSPKSTQPFPQNYKKLELIHAGSNTEICGKGEVNYPKYVSRSTVYDEIGSIPEDDYLKQPDFKHFYGKYNVTQQVDREDHSPRESSNDFKDTQMFDKKPLQDFNQPNNAVDQSIAPEATYAVVKKPNKRGKNFNPQEEPKPDKLIKKDKTDDNQITAKNSRAFWENVTNRNHLNNGNQIKIAGLVAKDRHSNRKNEKVLPPPVAPKTKLSSKAKKSQDQKNKPNKNNFSEDGHQTDNFSEKMSTAHKASSGNANDSESDSADIIAIPRQTTIMNARSPNAHKPFVVTPAVKHILSWN
ncbi:unnamed protein product [Clavelina lepadiformis]|uniref:Uncharacterized protein n=1 Tax=Clavelina lepadiformis TaxID=159417 RepID=A0ABP0GFR6_CLALP